MKKNVISALFLLLVSGLAFADGVSVRISDDVLRIDSGSQSSGRSSTRDLEDRIARLEREIDQLRHELRRMSDVPRAVVALPSMEAPRRVSCYLKTTFKTFTGEGASKTEARGKVLKECEKGAGLGCDDDNIKCD